MQDYRPARSRSGLHKVGSQPGAFPVQPVRPAIPPPEANDWWWNPGRPGVASGPPWFVRKLDEVDPQLRITWNAYKGQYQLWMPKPQLKHRICSGWLLLFNVHPADLDERVFARLYSASQRKWGSARNYFDAIEREMERERERKEREMSQRAIDRAMPAWEHSRIRVGYGKSSGSKFSDYHA